MVKCGMIYIYIYMYIYIYFFFDDFVGSFIPLYSMQSSSPGAQRTAGKARRGAERRRAGPGQLVTAPIWQRWKADLYPLVN